jgi:hypothetical protein
MTCFFIKFVSCFANYTTNEFSKQSRYDYLKDSNGNKKNLFSRNCLYNIKYYFHLIEPSHLEQEYFEFNKYDV